VTNSRHVLWRKVDDSFAGNEQVTVNRERRLGHPESLAVDTLRHMGVEWLHL
jgi:hypothetical protein